MKTIEVLIVTRSVVLQQGLGALLESMPEVASVKAVRNLQSGYAWIGERQPKIVLLDDNLVGNDPNVALDKIRSISPGAKRVVLTDDIREVNLLPTHAEAVLIKGVQPSVVAATISNLLAKEGEERDDEEE